MHESAALLYVFSNVVKSQTNLYREHENRKPGKLVVTHTLSVIMSLISSKSMKERDSLGDLEARGRDTKIHYGKCNC
jgi:hypothetical protein